MKEILAIIRMNTMNETINALSEAGFASMTAHPVFGRGKKKIDFSIIEHLIQDDAIDAPPRTIETISETHRLLAKRSVMLVVQDDEVDEVIDIILEHNQTGNMGDGKIFVMPISDVTRVRTGESGTSAI